MADSDSKYQDSFISQEDLDRLLEDADSLGPEAFAGTASDTDSPAADEELISQDDIDALLRLTDAPPDTAESQDQDMELISQDDIDALLESKTSAAKSSVEEDEHDDVGGDLDLVTPEDIEKLLRAEASDVQTDALQPDASGLDTITQEDLLGLTGGQEIKAEAGLSDGDDDALISQEDINALLAGAMPADKPAPKPAAEKAAPQPAAQKAPPQPVEVPEPEAEDSLINQEDIDSLLAGADMLSADDAQEENEEDASNLISQDDIDKLLLGKSEEAEAEETLIDQDDIDRLLGSAQPFDDEKLSASAAQDKLISQEDIDRLLNEDFAESGKEDEDLLDQVILESGPDRDNPTPDKKRATWYRSRLFVSLAAAVGLVLLFSLVSVMIFSGDKDADLVQTDTPQQTPSALDTVEKREFDAPPAQAMDIIRVTMNDFLVPAPAKSKGLAYIALNLSLEISDAPSDPIKDYEPFFRNIVYEVITKAFDMQNDARIVEADLKKMIKDALNDALSEGSVSRIDFAEFTAG